MRPFLQKILLSKYENEWTYAYTNARTMITDKLLLVEKPDDIFGNPSYYAGYSLKSITCNLRLKYSVPAEIMHSSIINHGCASMLWTITEHIVIFMERQQHHYDRNV